MRAEPKIVPGARRRQRRATVRHRDLAVGIVACLQTHGSRANWHPHVHLPVTDGGFRPDGTFVSWSAQDTARLTEAFRRAVLRLFVRPDLFDEEQAAGMLAWPHSGFHVHTAVWVPEDDRAFATRLARWGIPAPMSTPRRSFRRSPSAPTAAVGRHAPSETDDHVDTRNDNCELPAIALSPEVRDRAAVNSGVQCLHNRNLFL